MRHGAEPDIGLMIDLNLLAAPSVRIDVSGQDFVVGVMNRGLAELVDCHPEAFVGQAVSRLFGEDHVARMLETYRDCVRTRSAATIETSLKLSNTRRWWQASVLPILDPSGSGVVGLVNVATAGRRPRGRDDAKRWPG